MSTSIYMPLVILLVLYAGLTIAANVYRGRENRERADRLLDLAFGVALGAAAYAIVLTVLAAVDAPARFTDALTVIVSVVLFFVLLLGVFFGIGQLVGLFSRRSAR